MNIIKYKHLKNINFAFGNSTIIFSNDILINQDLIELSELIIKGKNPDPDLIRLEECDTLVVNKNFKVIVVPSLFDLRKNVLTGTKNLLAMLIKEIVIANKYTNENLNLIQNLFHQLDLVNEIEQLKLLQKDIRQLTHLTLELDLTEVLENYISENVIASLFNPNAELVKEDDIDLFNIRLIYFKILEFFGLYLENEVFFIFDNPFLGLNYREIQMIKEMIDKFPNKICITNILLNITELELKTLTILLSNLSINIPVILNDWNVHQFYLTEKYDPNFFLIEFINKMLKLINLYDEEWIKYDQLTENEILFWENIKNKIVF